MVTEGKYSFFDYGQFECTFLHTFTVLLLLQYTFVTFEYVLHCILLRICLLRNCKIKLS